MRALCVSFPNNVKYEFSCMLTEESCKLTFMTHMADTETRL